MRAARLRHRITLRTFTESQNAIGENIKSYANGDTIWAAVEPTKGNEKIANSHITSETDVKFLIRYKTGITPEQQITWDSKTYEIVSIINPEQRNRELAIYAKYTNE